MASFTNPIAQMAMAALQARGGQGPGQGGAPPPSPVPGAQAGPGAGGPGGDSGGPGGAGGLGDQYSQMVSELKGADPGMILRQVKALKQILAIMAVQNMERLPNVAGKIMKIIPQFDGVVKEITQAQNVNAAVRNPIAMGAANPPQGLPSNPGPSM